MFLKLRKVTLKLAIMSTTSSKYRPSYKIDEEFKEILSLLKSNTSSGEFSISDTSTPSTFEYLYNVSIVISFMPVSTFANVEVFLYPIKEASCD